MIDFHVGIVLFYANSSNIAHILDICYNIYNMLLTQHQTQNAPKHLQDESSEGKRHWPKLAVISFWIGLLILVNIVIAAWINTDSQYAVFDSDETTMNKIVQSINEGKDQFLNIFSKDKTHKRKVVVPEAPYQVAKYDTFEGQDIPDIKNEEQEDGSFSVRDFWDTLKESAGTVEIDSPLPDSPDAITGQPSGNSYGNIGGFTRGARTAGKLVGVARTLNGMELQDQLIDALSTQVKGASVFSGGRHTMEGYREFVSIGDQIGKLYNQVSTPVVSADGKNVAYFALDGEIMKVILNGQEVASYKDFGPTVYQDGVPIEGRRSMHHSIPQNYLRSLAEDVLKFKPNGQLVYTAWKSRKPLAVVGGTEGEQFDIVHNPIISPDGSHVAYIVAQAMNVGGELTTPGGCNTAGCIQTFSKMASRAFAMRAFTYFVIADGVMSFPYDEILNLTYSPNGDSFGFLGRRDNRWYAVINDEESNAYDEIRALQFDFEGGQNVFAARRGNVWSIIKNGSAIAQLANAVGDELFYNFANGTYSYSDPGRKFYTGDKNIPGFLLSKSPNANQVALLRQIGTEAQVVLYDLVTGLETAHSPSATVVQSLLSGAGKSNISFSSDGEHVAYPLSVNVDGRMLQQMVVDGISHVPYNSVLKPVFSPNGLMVAYAATAIDPLTGLEMALAVIDGQESEFFNRILSQPEFSLDGNSVRYLAEKSGVMEWITHSVSDVLAQSDVSIRSVAAPSPFPGLFCPPNAVFKDLEIALQQPKNTCGLSLPDGDRKNLPKEIGSMVYLKHLNLSFNRIEAVPSSIGNLRDLRWLSLVGNMVEELPESLGGLTGLEYLDVSSNAIRVLPEEIGNLQNLRILNISGNNLRELPESLGTLTNLERVYLNGNNISKRDLKDLEERLPNTHIYGL